jgi:hypothetical protein
LQAQGFVAKKRKGDPIEPTTLEIDEGYAVCGLGEGSSKDVSFSRPKRAARTWRNTKVSGTSALHEGGVNRFDTR